MNAPSLRTIKDIDPEKVDKLAGQLGQLLAKARKNKYASALSASNDLDIGQSTYISYENGQRQKVLAWWLVAFRDVFGPRFGVEPSFLLGLSPEAAPTEAPVWLLSQIAPHIKRADAIMQMQIADEAMAPHLGIGDVAIFERTDTVSQGGIYAIEYPTGEVLPRWITPSAVGGWQIKDGRSVVETVSDDDLDKLSIRGRYLFRMTK